MLSKHHWELTQWIEYHRMVGFERFLVYLNEAYVATTLLNASDITYIPWNYKRFGNPNMAAQAAQQQDCILRAQARNVTWLALLDVDEYIQVMDNNTTLDDILVSHKDNEEMGGIQMPSWFFGENLLLENRTMSELMIDSVWRGPAGYGGQTAEGPLRGFGREKLIVRPRRIFYFACHKLILGGSMIPEPRIRMNHYKSSNLGVFSMSRPYIQHSDMALRKDYSLRDAYGPKLRQRLSLPPLGSTP
jgi:hypothetical protein